MALNRLHLDAAPERVFEVLTDPTTYPRWLVGAKHIRSVDDDWPAVGSAFRHVVGGGPIRIRDATSVLEVRRPDRLVLHARAGLTGIARVVFTLAPALAGGTDLTMQEYPARGPISVLAGPLIDLLTRFRNEASLRKLRPVVERRPSAAPRAA